MTPTTRAESKPMQALRRIALRFPGAAEGTSCDKRAFKARDKAFLFVGMNDTSYDVMLKLRDSLPEAAQLAAKHPGRFAVGGIGWVKAVFNHDEAPPPGLFERWIDESYRLLAPRLLAPRRLAALLSEPGPPAGASVKTAKKGANQKRKRSRP